MEGEASGRRSDVWSHFIVSKDGDGKDITTCKNCRKSLGAETRNGDDPSEATRRELTVGYGSNIQSLWSLLACLEATRWLDLDVSHSVPRHRPVSHSPARAFR